MKKILQGPVYMYYGLTNFYQNHRRYVKSRDDFQLIGEKNNYNQLSSDCDPFRGVQDPVTGLWKAIAPCGTIANSLFNGLQYKFLIKVFRFYLVYQICRYI